MKILRLAALCLLLALPALASAASPLTVAVSIPPQAWLVERLGGPALRVVVMLPPGRSPATYEPTPKQLAALGQARLYLSIGVPFEGVFLPRLRAKLPGLKIVSITTGIKLRRLESHHHEGQAAEPDQAPGAPDPHVWMSPRRARTLAANAAAALMAADPARAALYRANLARLDAELVALDAELARTLAPLRGRTIFVYHPAYGYLADDYGLKQEAVELEGKEPGPRRLAALVAEAKADGVRVIFVQPQFPRATAAALARAIGGAVVPLDPLAADYLGNLRAMAAKIAQALR
ncbi:MAG: ABC transporter substrate-binding protein [Desulfarculus sp.]|nr:MAG: ABC transporter substrate-binding protein [Desulfarculus sp.]